MGNRRATRVPRPFPRDAGCCGPHSTSHEPLGHRHTCTDAIARPACGTGESHARDRTEGRALGNGGGRGEGARSTIHATAQGRIGLHQRARPATPCLFMPSVDGSWPRRTVHSPGGRLVRPRNLRGSDIVYWRAGRSEGRGELMELMAVVVFVLGLVGWSILRRRLMLAKHLQLRQMLREERRCGCPESTRWRPWIVGAAPCGRPRREGIGACPYAASVAWHIGCSSARMDRPRPESERQDERHRR
jgi:hypothetical protein